MFSGAGSVVFTVPLTPRPRNSSDGPRPSPEARAYKKLIGDRFSRAQLLDPSGRRVVQPERISDLKRPDLVHRLKQLGSLPYKLGALGYVIISA